MSKKGRVHEPPEAQKPPISIRLSRTLAPEIALRQRAELDTPAGVIRRDLERYYVGCEAALRKLQFDWHDANILVDLVGTLDASNARYLWAELDEGLRRQSRDYAEGGADHARAQALVAQLRAISPFDAIAVIDALEIYWDNYKNNGNDRTRALDISRLTTDLPEHYLDALPAEQNDDE
jgi:hypothetical protein